MGNGTCIGKNVAGIDCDVVSVYWGGAAILRLKSVTDIAWGRGEESGYAVRGGEAILRSRVSPHP